MCLKYFNINLNFVVSGKYLPESYCTFLLVVQTVAVSYEVCKSTTNVVGVEVLGPGLEKIAKFVVSMENANYDSAPWPLDAMECSM
jgi:hypothetical protein